MNRRKKKRKASFGVIFWLAFVFFVFSLYLHNRADIQQVLEKTGLIQVLADRFVPGRNTDTESGTEIVRRPPAEEQPVPPPDGSRPRTTPAPPDKGLPLEIISDDQPDNQPAEPSAPDSVTDSPDQDDASGTDITDPAGDTGNTGPAGDPDTDRPVRRRDFGLYFIRVTDDGRIHTERVTRTIGFTDSPLTQVVQSVIDGPTSDELSEGLLNLIPGNTQLLSATVRDGVAYLNFNEEFRFNSLGVEGSVAQLKQIIYSTTEFETVQSVQILIEGRNLDYLGGDGVYIGRPLSRNSFS
jgi:germination protein M